MKFDDSCTMHEYVTEMTNIATKLKSMGMEMNENFLVCAAHYKLFAFSIMPHSK